MSRKWIFALLVILLLIVLAFLAMAFFIKKQQPDWSNLCPANVWITHVVLVIITYT
jgi:hypothetical protein